MSDQREARALEIFSRVIEAEPARREPVLLEACGEDVALLEMVRALLAADQAQSPTLEAGVRAIQQLAEVEGPTLVGRRVGPYTIIDVLGRGGMGVVCLAERADVGKRVALKLVRGALGSPEAIRRFARERRVLAQLDHPNIARLLDAGTADDGTPWFAMDLITGRPLDRYCDEERLSPKRRVTLVRRIADAVAHAHRQLIVHRDLKPANVLVDDTGEPKLLDFGIAKLLDDTDPDAVATGTGIRLLTPRYASPEQLAGMPITTASDIYQLGLLLHQLLTGRAPEGGLGVDRRRGELPTDLDTIIAKATDPDPSRRYQTVAALGDDLERFTTGHPVLARPATLVYRLGRFVARNRVASVLGAVAALGAMAFIATVQIQSRRVERERERAEQVATLLGDLLAGADPEVAQGDTTTVAGLLDRSASQILRDVDRNPRVNGRLALVAAEAYANLDRKPEAIELQAAAVRALERIADDQDSLLLASRARLASFLAFEERFDSAGMMAEQALAAARSLPERRRAELGYVLQQVELVRQLHGDVEGAQAAGTEALAIFRELPDSNNVGIEAVLVDLAFLAGRGSEIGVTYLREALERRRRRLGEDHSLTAKTMVNLASHLAARGQSDEAEGLLDRAREVIDRVYPGETELRAGLLQAGAALLANRGKWAEAESVERIAVGINLRRGDTMAVYSGQLADWIQAQGRLAQAESLRRHALAYFERQAGSRHNLRSASSAAALAYNLFAQRKLDAADSLYRAVVPILDSAAARIGKVASATYDHAFLLAVTGRCAEALPMIRDILQRLERDTTALAGGPIRPERTLGFCLMQTGKYAEAEPVLLRAHQKIVARFGAEHQFARGTATNLRQLYELWGKPEEAARYQTP